MSLREQLEKVGYRLHLAAGDIVTVKDKEIRFPRNLLRIFRDKRWAVVLSNATLCGKYDVVSIAPMTTNNEVKSEADLEIAPTKTNGIEKKSRIELDHAMPVHRDWIIKKVGRLSDAEWDLLMKQLYWNYFRPDDE